MAMMNEAIANANANVLFVLTEELSVKWRDLIDNPESSNSTGGYGYRNNDFYNDTGSTLSLTNGTYFLRSFIFLLVMPSFILLI